MLRHLVVQFPVLPSTTTVRDELWATFNHRLPGIAAGVLMPDHAHFVGSVATERALKVLARHPERTGGLTLVLPAKPPGDLPNNLHQTRTFRYVWLNPCRDRLVDDPLAWPWSTYRDVLRLTAVPWVEPFVTLQHLEPRFREAEALHGYVSGDPSCQAVSSSFPRARTIGREPLVNIVAAVRCAAAPLSAREQRRAFIQLAHSRGHSVEVIADALTCCRSTAFRDLHRPVASAIFDRAIVALGDTRLLTAGHRPTPWFLESSEAA